MKYIGGVGYFQITMVRLAMMSMFSVGFCLHLISYAAADPTFECQYGDMNSEYLQCFESDACELMEQGSKRGRVKFEYNSWTKQANLGCESTQFRDVAKTYYLIGTAISLFVLLMASDFCGRKKGFYAVFVVSMLGMALAFAIPDYSIRVAALGVAMTCYPSYSALYTIYFTEILRKYFLI